MRVQLKRTGLLNQGKALEPQAANMAHGELAVNYNASDSCIFIKDSDNNIVRISSAGIPIPGDDTQQPGTLDERYVMISGSTMTGPLILNADPTDTLGAVTKQYVDSIEFPAAPETSPTPPTGDKQNGQLWWNSTDGRLYIWYVDVDSSQWVPATPESTSGGIGDDWSSIPALP